MDDPKPTCPRCNAPLKLEALVVPRPAPSSSPRIIPKRLWVCSNDDCMYTASQHVHAFSR